MSFHGAKTFDFVEEAHDNRVGAWGVYMGIYMEFLLNW